RKKFLMEGRGALLNFLRKEGYRMPAPQNTPDSVYQLMLRCWDANPATRISFHDLHTQLKGLVDSPPKGESWS
ncbi:FER-like protein, partial [Mya arenaria]